MDIGSKIRQARSEVKLTQEQAAEALGISRQTISNWETGKTYPDIISVLKMSDLYHVSLDVLLKGEQTMNGYMDYLEESTNVVKSRRRLVKLLLILSYVVIWAAAVLVFWIFTAEDEGIGYSLMFLWVILPVSTFIIALLIGWNDCWGRGKWFTALGFGILYMLAEYATFSMANTVAFGKINMPEFSMLAAGTIISLAGLGLGHLLHRRKNGRRPA